ncbi:hypothetical protein [Alteromonas antoniana]|uniref:hypothetical protein n=1 Tax=Alteromonas antoniana TaxID=2803813 RepID=UPI001C47CE5F|nr:hypothetical protein [Alteromonas antoniana]
MAAIVFIEKHGEDLFMNPEDTIASLSEVTWLLIPEIEASEPIRFLLLHLLALLNALLEFL